MNRQKIINSLFQYPFQFGLYFLLAVVASIQLYLLGEKVFEAEPDLLYTNYNNYIIFKESFFHLLTNQDIYQLYPDKYWDLYKYSPTFSLFFGLFAYFPDVIGMTLWNLLNALVFFFSIWYLPQLNARQKGFVLLFVAIEMLTSLQSVQSNGLMAGLLIFAFGFLERKHIIWATLMVVLSIYIKLFGLVAFALFLFYPQKIKAFFWTIGWSVLLFCLPILLVGWAPLLDQYNCWWYLLDQDQDSSLGYSVMGWLSTWFGLTIHKFYVLIAGVLLFLFPLSQLKRYKDFDLRLLTLASVLLWVIIFNHKAESPTFIIALAGVSIWYVWVGTNRLNTSLLVLAFIFTTLSVTDLFPPTWKSNFLIPYVIKTVPCILIWFKIVGWDMWKKPWAITS